MLNTNGLKFQHLYGALSVTVLSIALLLLLQDLSTHGVIFAGAKHLPHWFIAAFLCAFGYLKAKKQQIIKALSLLALAGFIAAWGV